MTDMLNNTPPVGTLSQTSLDTMKANISLARTNIAGKYATLIAGGQAINAGRSNYNSLKTVADRAVAALNDAKNPPRAVDLAGARAAVAAAQVNYDKTVLKAPFDGTISRQDGELGTLTVPGVPLVSIISNNKYQVEVYIAETDLPKVTIGANAEITLDNLSADQKFPATVIKLDPAASQLSNGTSAYKATLQFVNEDDRLKVGLTVNVKIIGPTKDNVLIIPAHDLVQKNGQYFAMVLNTNKTLEQKAVEVGLKSDNDNLEIVSGLNTGDQIVSFSSLNN